ncbi:MAG: DUF6597 domain-containing transcriptional factor, partial [Planctomycetota bacterium]
MMNYKPYQSMSETRSKCNLIYSAGYAPGRHLQPYVESYWTMVSAVELPRSIHHRVIPDGCIDIIFDLSAGSYREAASVVGTMTRPEWRFLKRHSSFSIALVWFLILGSVCALVLRLAVHFCQ